MQTAYNEQKSEALQAYIRAISEEIRSGYEYDDTITRINAGGFLEGIVHLGIILGLESEAVDVATIERTVSNAIKSTECQHDLYSTSAYPADGITENRCDNCNAIVNWTL